MRLPNGFGSVHKLTGNRRKPYRVRITVGWEDANDINRTQKYKTIGYFATKEEGLIALACFNKNPYDITYKILSELPFDKNIMLDAVHSYKEWKIIKSINKEAIIVLVTTPEMIRATRWEEGDKEKDKMRIKYWHSDYEGESGCLLTEVSWSFNGAASLETNIANFEELIHCYGLNNNNNKNKQKILTRK